jgi:hypothetical protein
VLRFAAGLRETLSTGRSLANTEARQHTLSLVHILLSCDALQFYEPVENPSYPRLSKGAGVRLEIVTFDDR